MLESSYQMDLSELTSSLTLVVFYNNIKEDLRDEVSRGREALVQYAGQGGSTPLNPPFETQPPITAFTGGTETATGQGTTLTTKGELESYIRDTEEKLSSVSDDAQLANVDYQNVLQKQNTVLLFIADLLDVDGNELFPVD